jgi:hypothetical protein
VLAPSVADVTFIRQAPLQRYADKVTLECAFKTLVGLGQMNDSTEYIGSSHFDLDAVSYSIGLRGDPRGGLRGTWRCPHCSLVVATSQAVATPHEAVDLAKIEVTEHHNEHHHANSNSGGTSHNVATECLA